MSEQTAQEPTMEEILASIRRIISEDDAPAGGARPPGADEPAAAEASGGFELPNLDDEPVAPEEDVLELTERVETHGDIDAYIPEPEPELQPSLPPLEPEPESDPFVIAEAPQPHDGLVSAATASVAAAAFGQLSSNIMMPPGLLTLDEVVRELLRPLLKDWLDANLPQIVQTAVSEEVERIARGRR